VDSSSNSLMRRRVLASSNYRLYSSRSSQTGIKQSQQLRLFNCCRVCVCGCC